MRDLIHLPSSTLDIINGAAPAGPGPIRLSLDDAPERERPALYREFFGRSLFRLDVEPLRDHALEVDVVLQKLPGLRLFSGRLHGSRNQRTRAFLADGVDDFTLLVNLGGPYQVCQGQHELVLGDGEGTFLTCAEPVSFAHHPPGDVLALQVPRAPFAPLVRDVEDRYLRRIPRDTPALRLLLEYVRIARDDQTVASPCLQQLIVSHVYDLVAASLGARRDDTEARAQVGGVRAARLHALKQDIARHLDQPDLSVNALAARQRLTPRCIQRLFEADGTTFTEYVLAQRLARARRLLGDPRRGADKISTIAFDAGFADVSYFNRMFRQRFGMAPSDMRAQARQGAA
jgi:AraC-like DNA-binding protein